MSEPSLYLAPLSYDEIAIFLKDNLVTGFVYKDESRILISFKNTTKRLKLKAAAECCNKAWFDNHDLTCIIGKEIREVYSDHYTIRICFTDGLEFPIMMHNSDAEIKGGYGIWLSMSIVDNCNSEFHLV